MKNLISLLMVICLSVACSSNDNDDDDNDTFSLVGKTYYAEFKYAGNDDAYCKILEFTSDEEVLYTITKDSVNGEIAQRPISCIYQLNYPNIIIQDEVGRINGIFNDEDHFTVNESDFILY